MKKNIILIVVVWITLLLTFSLTSCSGSSDAPEEVVPPTEAENVVKIINLSYPLNFMQHTGGAKPIKSEFDGTIAIKVVNNNGALGVIMVGSSNETVQPKYSRTGYQGASEVYRLNGDMFLLLGTEKEFGNALVIQYWNVEKWGELEGNYAFAYGDAFQFNNILN